MTVVSDESASVCLRSRPSRVLGGKKSNFAWSHSRPDLQFSFCLVHHSPINSQTIISFERLDLSDHDRAGNPVSSVCITPTSDGKAVSELQVDCLAPL